MADDRSEQIKDLLEAALRLPVEKRVSLLDALDPSLRQKLESLLASHEEADSVLEEPPPVDSVTLTRQKDVEADDRQIGPYRILREIGHGGMGVVYEAEQEKPVHRRVALKLIKLGMDTQQVIARFESERQALALMGHPNIASVYDAGATDQGRPYFAMEYVHGIPITEYCDKHRLVLGERLELFLQLCEGVQHAHQKGIIHRDLKPSNVLVAIKDEKLVPKIIDFGVAKATSQRLTERTLYTEYGQLVGTPEYMSPEQAEMTGLDVDTRTDVYSLGVILYELLVGAQPYDPAELRRAGFDGLRRKIREEEPPKPSTRLIRLGDTSTSSARNRRVELWTLERELQGDLDWITMKALEKDRTRRYGSASEFAVDIRRHLKHEPVLARPPSATYRLRKFVRRHRMGVAAAVFVLLALMVGLAGATIGMVRARTAEGKASAEAAKAQAINAFLQETLGSANPLEGIHREVTVLEALDAAVEEIDRSFGDQPEIAAAVKSTIGLTYLRLDQHEKAEPLLRQALETQRSILGDGHAETVGSLTGLGLLRAQQGKSEEAERLYRNAIELARKLPEEDQAPLGEPLLNLAGSAWDRGDFDAAESMYREVLEIWHSAAEEYGVAWASDQLADLLYYEKGEYDEAEALYRDALARFRKLRGSEHLMVADVLRDLGRLIARLDAPPGQAEGDCEAALPLLQEAIEIIEKVYGSVDTKSAGVRSSYAECLIRLGRFEAAEELLLATHSRLRDALGEKDPATVSTVGRLVQLYESWGKQEKAGEYRALQDEESQ